MIKYNGKAVDLNHFPDGTLLIKEEPVQATATITWLYENNEEMVAVYFLTKHLQAAGIRDIALQMPYIPNARQDRVKSAEDVFTLKYFAEMINSLGFSKVTVLDPHSYVSEALIDRIDIRTPKEYVEKVIAKLEEAGASEPSTSQLAADEPSTAQPTTDILLFFPDEGAMKRYSVMFDKPYAFGIKKRDWATGQILGLEVSGQAELVKGRKVLIVDDICSKGGTFYHSAKALKELGAEEVYLYVSHCENSIFQGELLTSDVIKKIYTTNSIFTKEHEKVEVFSYE